MLWLINNECIYIKYNKKFLAGFNLFKSIYEKNVI